MTLVPSPAVGGGRAHLCETEAGWGAGWRDHLSGDPRVPGSPCFQPPLLRDRGGGYVLCGGGVRGWRGRGLCMVDSCAGRSGCGRAAARGCAGASTWLHRGAAWDRARAQYGAAEARTLLRWGAAWVCNAAQHAAAQGAQRGVAQGTACSCAGEPRGAGLEGGSLAHHRSTSRRERSGCNGCV